MIRLIFVFTFLSCMTSSVFAGCKYSWRYTSISYFHNDERPPRVELWQLDEGLKFKDHDKCQAHLVYNQIKNGGEIIKDPETKRLVHIEKVTDSDWLKEMRHMCSMAANICED